MKKNICFLVFIFVVITGSMTYLYMDEKNTKVKKAARIAELKALERKAYDEQEAEKDLRADVFMYEIGKEAQRIEDSKEEAIRKVAEAIRDK